MIFVISFRDKKPSGIDTIVNTTSRSGDFGRGLSPFLIGPCRLYGKYHSVNMENAWQYSKVYYEYLKYKEINGEKIIDFSFYYEWAINGWSKHGAVRYPMGKGAIPEFSLWNNKRLDYIESRKKIYIPLYFNAVKNTEAWKELKRVAIRTNFNLALIDFDGYNYHELGMTLDDVVNNSSRKMGHSFVLAMMLEKLRLFRILKGRFE